MKRGIPAQLALLSVLSVLMLALTATWARQGSVFDQLDLLVDIRHELVTSYVEPPNEQAMMEAAVRGMIDSLDDPYTTYLNAEEFKTLDRYLTGSFSGIGAEIDIFENELGERRLRIVTPLEDSPAWKAGIMAGDIVLEINGQTTLDMELTEAVKLLTGEAGTTVNLLVRHESGQEQPVTITRGVINVQTVRGFRRNADHHFDFMLDDTHRIGYIRITQFIEDTAEDLHAALKSLQAEGAQGVILDLRFNPGGLLQSAVEVSDMFLSEGQTVVSVKSRQGGEQFFKATAQSVMPDLPIVVLANEASASAAEIVTGALKDNDRALFVGARTFGKGSVQDIRGLEKGQGALKMTTAYYYIPSGRLIHRREDSKHWGVDPSAGSYVPMNAEEMRKMVEVRRETDRLLANDGQNGDESVTPASIREQLQDPQLAAALEAVLGKINTGAWPQVGESGADELVEQASRANLVLQRTRLQERLAEIEVELAALDGEPEPAAVNDAENAAGSEEEKAAEPAQVLP